MTPAANLVPVSLTPVANYRQCRCHWWKFATTSRAYLGEDVTTEFDASVNDAGGQLAAGDVDTGSQCWDPWHLVRNRIYEKRIHQIRFRLLSSVT